MSQQTYVNIEQERVQQWGAGWNDAMLGKAPASQHLSYVLGYMDARRFR
jgi:hypothetical protein